jgi:hypothetical protein
MIHREIVREIPVPVYINKSEGYPGVLEELTIPHHQVKSNRQGVWTHKREERQKYSSNAVYKGLPNAV